MNYSEFLRQLGKAGLTISDFAEIVKMNRVSISNYSKKSEIPSHLAVIAILLGEMAERKINYREILSQISILPKKPRGAGLGKFGGSKQVDFDFIKIDE